MKNRVLKRLIALLLTGGVIISSLSTFNAIGAESETSSYSSFAVENNISAENENATKTETTETSEKTAEKSDKSQLTVDDNLKETVSYSTLSETGGNTDNKSTAVSWTGVNPSSSSEPGTEQNPYAVSDASHFLDMSRLINDVANSNKYFRLTADIDLSSVTMQDIDDSAANGIPNTIVSVDPDKAAESENVFFVFDNASNYRISGLDISDGSRNSLGIFGYLNSLSVIRDINFENITVESLYSSAVSVGLILKNEGTVENCSFANISVSSNSNNTSDIFAPITGNSFRMYSGVSAGIVDNEGTFTQKDLYDESLASYFRNITVTSTGLRPYIGGMVAQNRGYLNKFKAANVRIEGNEDTEYAGAAVGAAKSSASSTVNGIYYVTVTLGNNSVKGGNFTGCIAGANTGRINYCTVQGNYNAGSSLSDDDWDIYMFSGKAYGGITGSNSGIIDKCSAVNVGAYNSSDSGNTLYGGIAGTNVYTIQNSVASGVVYNSNDSVNISAGGIVGKGSMETKFFVGNCYSLVKLPKTPSVLGCIVGVDGDEPFYANKIRNCRYSSIVCGRPSATSYGGTGSSYGDLQFGAPYTAVQYGNGSNNRVTVNASDFTYSGWGDSSFAPAFNSFTLVPGSTAGVAFNSSASSVEFFRVAASTTSYFVQDYRYDNTVTLPAGIGNSSDSGFSFTESFLFKVLYSGSDDLTGRGTVESPYLINTNTFRFVGLCPYGHYKLSDNVLMNSAAFPSEYTSVFYGTLDGNGKQISVNYGTNTSAPSLFNSVYGSRSEVLSFVNEDAHTSNPADDSPENLKNGVIKNINFRYFTGVGEISTSSLLGDICSATVRNVNVKLDASSTVKKPYYIPDKTGYGFMFRGVYGNSYLYGCYNDGMNVKTSLNGVSTFIGSIDGNNVIIDNCGSSGVVLFTEGGDLDYNACFIGEIKANKGYIMNCYASGGVTVSSSSYSISPTTNYIFAAKSVSNAKIFNCYYSPSDYYSTGLGVSRPIPDGKFTGDINLWGFKDSVYIITSTGSMVAKQIKNINRFDNETYARVGAINLDGYFEAHFDNPSGGYSVNTVRYQDGDAESPLTGVAVSVVVGLNPDETNILYLKNLDTGLVAKGSVVSSSEIEYEDGYYLIKKPTDLYNICNDQGDLYDGVRDKYLGASYKFKLMANINMAGYTLPYLWGKSSDNSFKGEFIGELNADGTPKYTISNLTVNGANHGGLFGYVEGAVIKGIGLENPNVSGGNFTGSLVAEIQGYADIENCKVKNATVNGKSYVGGLIGGISNDDSYGTNATVIKNCILENSVINSSSEFRYNVKNPSNVGGIIGSVGTSAADINTKKATVSGCKVINSTVYGDSYYVGGVAGYAPCTGNIFGTCEVNGSTVRSDTTDHSLASLGGIAGAFGGSSMAQCNIINSHITGENASGVVGRLVNFTDETKITACVVTGCDVTGINYAGGILGYIGALSASIPLGQKTLEDCKTEDDTVISAKVAGGFVGVIMNYTHNNTPGGLTVQRCVNYATVKTTDVAGSTVGGAGGAVGRLSSGFNPSGIHIKDCIIGGAVSGYSVLGGVIANVLSSPFSSGEKLISNCYVTVSVDSGSLRTVRGLIIGNINSNNSSNLTNMVENVYFSSFGGSVLPYGSSVSGNVNSTYHDVNLGADNTTGITPVPNTAGTNAQIKMIADKSSGNILTINKDSGVASDISGGSRYKLNNMPDVSGFAITPSRSSTSVTGEKTWKSLNENKVILNQSANFNTYQYVAVGVYKDADGNTFKGRTGVYSNFIGSPLSGYTSSINKSESVTFRIGFTVVCDGIHKFEGKGTVNDPYKIYDEQDLIEIKCHHDNPLANEDGPSFYTANYMVMNDIDISQTCGDTGTGKLSFPAIGTENEPFRGTLTSAPGNAFTIRNLYIVPDNSGQYTYAVDSEVTEFSDNLALFGYTDGASVSNLNFENATVSGGASDAVVVGYGVNTTISNVNITGDISISEAQTGAFVVGSSGGNLNISDVAVEGTLSGGNYSVSITAQGTVGGIVGAASGVASSTLTAVSVKNASIKTNGKVGAIYAGGIAAQLNGVITGRYETRTVDDTEEIYLSKPCLVEHCIIEGICSGGIVGSGSSDQGDNDYGLTVKGARVVAAQVNSVGTSTLSIGAGILGRTYESYNYIIEDCTVDSASSINATYVAGGIAGSVNITNKKYPASFSVEKCESYASVSHTVTGISETSSARKSAGVGGIVGLLSSTACIRNTDTDEALFTIRDCKAGGALSGSTPAGGFNVGGIIGQFASTQIYAYRITDHLVENCIVLCSFDIPAKAPENLRYGIVCGAIEGNVSESDYPFSDRDDYVSEPFHNIYYSSYSSSSFTAFGKSVIYTYQNSLTSTVIDLNKPVWRFEEGGNDVDLPIMILKYEDVTVPGGSEYIDPDHFYFDKDFWNSVPDKTGNLLGFTISDTVFEIESLTSGDETKMKVCPPHSTIPGFTGTDIVNNTDNYMITSNTFGEADLIFNYTNGLKIAISVTLGVSFEGDGSAEDPIKVSNDAIFVYIVPILKNYYFEQTADITIRPTYGLAAKALQSFGGHYNGNGHTLSGLNLNITDTSVPGGIFGTVSGEVTDTEGNTIPNIENLVLDNCHINASDVNSVGIVAGEVTNGATVKNVTIQNSSVTGSSPVGGAVGLVSGGAKLENVNVSDTTVTALSGSAGGVAGIMDSVDSSISSCCADGVTVTSGFNYDDIAGGIVAQAVGTINGKTSTENETVVLESTVNGSTVSAYISGGAVGSMYKTAELLENAPLILNDIKVSSTEVVADYADSSYYSSVAAGMLGRIHGATVTTRAVVEINNCYVDKNSTVSSKMYASGCIGINANNLIDSIALTDTESYASVTALQKEANKTTYAGGLVSYLSDIDCNILTMDGCVAGGKIKSGGYISYVGGAIGYFKSFSDGVSRPITEEFFVNGVLSATVESTDGSEAVSNTSTAPKQYYGKFVGGFFGETFIENEDFSTVVFHDIYYSSYPQDCNFFGMGEIDSFQSITESEVPFENINVGTNFTVSEYATAGGPWNPIAIARNLNEEKTFYAKFNTPVLPYGNGKVSTVDEEGFTIVGKGEGGENIFEITGNTEKRYDAEIGDYYSFSIVPQNYGSGKIGASYTCGLATSLPIICVYIEGTGAQNDPFLITNPIQLYVVSFLAHGGYYFRQENDIDLSNTYSSYGDDEEVINYNGESFFNPIGTLSNPFDGNYDGQGYLIKGLKSLRNRQDYVGLFGYVQTQGNNIATIKNVHVELLESDGILKKTNGIIGQNFVGGLCGYAEGAVIDNCSVVRSTVIGRNYVGALCGSVAAGTEITRCFTASDVYATETGGSAAAGGIAGIIDGNDVEIDKCIASGNIFADSGNALTQNTGKSGGLVGNIRNGQSISLSNCLFTGSANSGFGAVGEIQTSNRNTVTLSSVIDAGMETGMNNGHFTAVSRPMVNGQIGSFTNCYYDNAHIKLAEGSTSPAGITPLMTSALSSGENIAGIINTNWSYSAGSYPVPKLKSDDSYSVFYGKLLAIALKTSESEECDELTEDTSDVYGRGLMYPVQLLQKAGSFKITYSSSVFDKTDIVPYPEGYDTNLYGVGTNKQTDLLFEDINDEGSSNYGYTSVYRNIFARDTGNDATHRVESYMGGACLDNGEISYNLQTPVVFAKINDGQRDYYREIKLPLNYGNSYCIATQRQLFALGLAEYEMVPGSKFEHYYGSNYNYSLITDIFIDQNNDTEFVPIGKNDEHGYTGQFNGNGHTIKNLNITSGGESGTGLFAKISNYGNTSPASYTFIKNLNLADPIVSGTNRVGALVGQITDSNILIEGCSVTSGGSSSQVYGNGSYVGGLIGYVDYASNIIRSCNSSIKVIGTKDSIGGLIGYSGATVTSCYATGEVSTQKINDTCGIGGLIGYMVRGSAGNCFASGNVVVSDFSRITTEDKTFGVGGFVGILGEGTGTSKKNAIVGCFSGGNVSFAAENPTGRVNVAGGKTGIIGVGGFCGVNYAEIKNCYSSAAVNAGFAAVKNSAVNSTYGVGIGGVCGVSLYNVSNIYSSGSASKPTIPEFDEVLGNAYYGVGGTIGTTMGASATFSNCFFDSWTNTDSQMTSIGDRADNNTKGIRSYTTDEYTNGVPLSGFDTNIWGFSQAAYPYLRDMLNETVAPAIRANSILSVIVVEIDDEDYSARTGHGITMAITVPTEFKYISYSSEGEREVTYELNWEGLDMGSGNKATPVRTKNVAEYLQLIATVRDLEQYGSRTYERLCADMKGTYYQPYLVGSKADLEHVNMSLSQHNTAKANYSGFYDQWATPLDDTNQPVEGTVYYQLMNNIDAQSRTSFTDLTGTVYSYTVMKTGTDNVEYEETEEFTFDGFVLNGNAYALNNCNGTGSYFPKLDSKSKLTNIIFNDISLTGSTNGNTALVGLNNGEIYDVYVNGTVTAANGQNAGLVAENNGTIDGCVSDVTINNAGVTTGGLAGLNNTNGVITNSASAGTVNALNTAVTVGGFAGENKGRIENCFSMNDLYIASGNNTVSSIGGFAGKNNAGTIDGCFSRTSVFCDGTKPKNNSTVALLAGTVINGTISNCYTSGNLGFYSATQDSMAFAQLSGSSVSISDLYADKAMAGGTSCFSYDYATPTNNIIKMESLSDKFTLDENETHYPTLTSVNEAVNTARTEIEIVIDEEDNEVEVEKVIEFEEGTVIRVYDILKKYAEVANATVTTKNSQYIDSLALNSYSKGVDSRITVDENVSWRVSPSGIINAVINDAALRTTDTAGTAVLTAYAQDTSKRGTEYSPELNIRVVTGVNNQNFPQGGYGTKDAPYKIGPSAASLQSLIYYGTNPELYFVLGQNINCEGFDFKQIPRFNAHLGISDTNSPQTSSNFRYTVYNLDLEEGGLFGSIEEGAYVGYMALSGVRMNSENSSTGVLADSIDNATVENIAISGEIKGKAHTGALAGRVTGENASVKGIVTSGYVEGTDNVGGVFGTLDGAVKVEDVLSTAYVTGNTFVAGIAGEMKNGAEMDDVIFAGMAYCQDSETSSNVSSAIVKAIDDASSVTDYYVDSQLNISLGFVGDSILSSAAKTSSKLTRLSGLSGIDGFVESCVNGEYRYVIPEAFKDTRSGYVPGRTMYGATVDLASIVLTIRSGLGSGTIGRYSVISYDKSIPGQTAGGDSGYNDPLVSEEVQFRDNPLSSYLSLTSDADHNRISVNVFDKEIDYTALKIYLYTNNSNSTIFVSTTPDRVFRYITPGMVITVDLSYEITLSDGTDDLDGKTLGLLIRNLYDTVGSKTDSTNIFSVPGSERSTETMSVASAVGGFYVTDMIPEGYKITVSAVDGNGNELTVSENENHLGSFVSLQGMENSSIHLNITVVSDEDKPWGLQSIFNSLWD